MLNLFRRSLIVAAALGGAALSSSALAATSNDNIPLGGTVASIFAFGVVDEGKGNDNLPLGGEGIFLGDYYHQVADLNISSNNMEGFVLTATSGHGFLRQYDGAVVHPLNYWVGTTDDGGGSGTVGDWTPASAVYTRDFSGPAFMLKLDMFIAYTRPQFLDPGNYEDTLNVVVTEK